MNIRLLVLFAAGLAAVSLRADPALVGHPGLASEKLDAPTLKAVLLGKKVAWDGAGRVTLAVLKAHADMTPVAFNNHWRRLAMTGGGTAPKSFDDEAALRKFVAETPGAIGFLDSGSVDGSVVVLAPGV
jgi:hypothetical protein